MNREHDSQCPKIGFVGGGNMAEAMIAGLITNNYEASKIAVSAPRAERRKNLNDKYGVLTLASNCEVVSTSDVVFLAVKPNKIQQVCDEIIAGQNPESLPLIISVAAGIPLNMLTNCLGKTQRLITAMPNLPSAVGEGMTCLFSDLASSDDRQLATKTLEYIGEVQWIAEQDDMHLAVSAAGSAPAYFFLMLESMHSAAKQQGLSDEVARSMVLKTAQGAIKMAVEDGSSFKSLRERVTSPNGTTHSAIQSFENGGFRSLVLQAMESATKRSKELASHIGAH